MTTIALTERHAEALACAKGPWQEEVVEDGLVGRGVAHPSLLMGSGAWDKYGASYWRSWDSLMTRLRKAGFAWVCGETGPRGGTTTKDARYGIVDRAS